MPIFMDVHLVPGVKAKDVAEAHRKDLLHQEDHGCNCMTYWIDEERENIFCLIEAPDKEAVEKMHRRAHGLLPNKIIEVDGKVVHSFLGRIYDPEGAKITSDGLKVFTDPSFRIILVTKTFDPVLLRSRLGGEKANELFMTRNQIIRNHISYYDGTEVEHEIDDFIISFSSATKAVSCAQAIQKSIKEEGGDLLGIRIGINAGEPVERSNQLFGDTIQFAMGLCTITDSSKIALSTKVRELTSKDLVEHGKKCFLTFNSHDESLLTLLFKKLEDNWQDPDFDISHFSQEVAMSTSALYRKTISLTGLSPNLLIKDFRLEKAKSLMRNKHYSIAQITYDSGFTSASYFTKCFKAKYSILPMAYLDLLS